jgi:biopolymer transport protein ExbD
MRIPNQFARRNRSLEISLTPMIDVVFQLMIFFVWTSSFEVPEHLLPAALVLPRGRQQQVEVRTEPEDLERLVIRLLWDENQPQWLVNNVPASGLDEVVQKLTAVAAISRDLSVLIDPDARTPLEHVIRTYDAAREAGFTRIQLAAAP